MNRNILIATALICSVSVFAATDRNILCSRISKEGLRESLSTDRSWVFLPAYTDRTGWDELLGADKEAYIKRGEEFLNHTWRRVKATDYLEFERSGDRAIMETPLRSNNSAMIYLLIAELAEGKGRFVDQLINGVYAAAEMTTWSMSAHLKRYNDHRSIQPYDKPVIDLMTGDMGNLYGWVHYFMKDEFDKVNPEISRRLKHELETRVLNPYLEFDKWWWDWSRQKTGNSLNNWTPWCLSNILLTAMLVEDDKDRYTEIAYNSVLGVDKYFNFVKGDGACEEGPTYWKHAAGKVLDYMELLRMATGGKFDISNEPLIKEMGEYIAKSYIGDGWVVNFADASAQSMCEPMLVYRYGKAVDSDLIKSFAVQMRKDSLYDYEESDLFEILAAIHAKPECDRYTSEYRRPAFSWYPETEFCYISTPQNLYFAAKGGFNNESHNHNDVGSFSLWADNAPIFIDAGVGTYTRQTFNKKERYKIWTMQSGWHNLPVINGYEQQYGSQYRSKNAKAEKTGFELDFADAYPKEAGVKNWIRKFKIRGRELKINDSYDLEEYKEPNVINFLTWGEIDTSAPGKVCIEINGQNTEMNYDSCRFEVKVEDKELPDPRLNRVWGNKISRISLIDKKKDRKGRYEITIKVDQR